MIHTVYRTRNGTPVRTFKVDLPLVNDAPQDPSSYIAAAMKMKGADFKFPGDAQNMNAGYGWRFEEDDA
jgi:hypothetical protein